jgi:hypothetical protein
VSPNVVWNGSLESYHPYPPPQKVSKIPKIECIHNRLPKNAKSHFGRLGPLGVNNLAQVLYIPSMVKKLYYIGKFVDVGYLKLFEPQQC